MCDVYFTVVQWWCVEKRVYKANSEKRLPKWWIVSMVFCLLRRLFKSWVIKLQPRATWCLEKDNHTQVSESDQNASGSARSFSPPTFTSLEVSNSQETFCLPFAKITDKIFLRGKFMIQLPRGLGGVPDELDYLSILRTWHLGALVIHKHSSVSKPLSDQLYVMKWL